MNIKVHVDFTQEVSIDPIDVIKKLIANEIGRDGWIFKAKNKYYRAYEERAGPFSIERKVLITKQKYEYINHLQFVLNHLQKKS